MGKLEPKQKTELMNALTANDDQNKGWLTLKEFLEAFEVIEI